MGIVYEEVTTVRAIRASHPAVYHPALSNIGGWQSFMFVLCRVLMSNEFRISFCPS